MLTFIAVRGISIRERGDTADEGGAGGKAGRGRENSCFLLLTKDPRGKRLVRR